MRIGLFFLLLSMILVNMIHAQEKWVKKGEMPEPRGGVCSAVVDGKIYIMGGAKQFGVQLDLVHEYDPATGLWSEKARIPTARAFAATAVVDGKIYVIGGSKDESMHFSAVEEYNPKTDTWEKKADMPTTRGILTASAVNGKIYVMGGYSADDMDGISIVEEYDPKTDKWSRKVANMNSPRYALDSAVVDGKIYAIGGSQGPSVSDVEVYDPEKDRWEMKEPMPTAREYLSVCALNSKIYTFGGANFPASGMSGTRKVEVYDPVENAWSREDDMPVNGLAFACKTSRGYIYLIGGMSELVFAGQLPLVPHVYEYNPEGLKSIKPHDNLATCWGSIKNRNR